MSVSVIMPSGFIQRTNSVSSGSVLYSFSVVVFNFVGGGGLLIFLLFPFVSERISGGLQFVFNVEAY